MNASVIIPTYNKLPLLQQTLTALAAQTVPADRYEVIVTDDASTDGTADFLRQTSYPFILKYVLQPQNGGRAKARNDALRKAANEVIIFVDDDIVAVPGFIEVHLACHTPDTRTVVIGNTVTAAAGRTGFTDYLDRTGVHRLAAGAPVPFKYFTSNNSSVPRSILDVTGFFDESFNTYGGEDTELGFRMQRRAGCIFTYEPSARAEHIHYRNANDALEQMETYGRTGLKDIYLNNAECADGLNLRVIERPAPFAEPVSLTLRKLLYRILYRAPVYYTVRQFAMLPTGPFRYRAYDYLISYRYLRGLRQGLRSAPS